jgi:hypothetical protein
MDLHHLLPAGLSRRTQIKCQLLQVSLPPRAISAHPNLVTQSGLRALERALADGQQALKTAQAIEDASDGALWTWPHGMRATSRNAARARFIHPVDAAIATRDGELLPHLTGGHPRHRFHDSLPVATAQIHGHGLTTRRRCSCPCCAR